jgi:glycosyltransferase involved in cell wall biosynthesis
MLSIITISYSDLYGLNRTIESVRDQVDDNPQLIDQLEHIVVVSGIGQYESENLRKSYDNKYAYFKINQDNSLYNAMNIGLEKATGTHLLFLNGGDVLYSKRSLGTITSSVVPEQTSLFRVIQETKTRSYVRPGRSGTDVKIDNYSHQGFVAPLCAKTPKFLEQIKINADTYWMKECLELFPVNVHDKIISRFELGGISNKPSKKTVAMRYHTNGLKRAALELIKLVLFITLGSETYYRFLAWRAGFEKIDSNAR